MEILDEGYDCKGRFYKKVPLKHCQDLTNQKFNLLTPLFRVDGKTTNWLCQCDCGNLTVVSARHLKAKEVKTCGMNHKRYDETDKHIGEKFGELILIERVVKEDVVRKDKVYWKELVRILPESWLQKRTITMNYENILSMCRQRKNHKLNEWSGQDNPNKINFIQWAKNLPYADKLIFIDE